MIGGSKERYPGPRQTFHVSWNFLSWSQSNTSVDNVFHWIFFNIGQFSLSCSELGIKWIVVMSLPHRHVSLICSHMCPTRFPEIPNERGFWTMTKLVLLFIQGWIYLHQIFCRVIQFYLDIKCVMFVRANIRVCIEYNINLVKVKISLAFIC